MKKKLSWQAFTFEERNVAIEKVKNSISRNDGCIVNFNMFSDMGMSLRIEIDENKIIKLQKALSSILKISDIYPDNLNPDSKKEWVVYMNITFGKGKGELKNEIPEVPG